MYSNLLLNIDNFTDISHFLCFEDLISLQRVSKQLHANCSQYFRKVLFKLNLISQFQYEDQKTTDFSKIYRQVFNKEVLFTNISQLQVDKNTIDNLKVYRMQTNSQLFNKPIKSFQIGNKFTAFLTYDNVLFYCKTLDYFNKKENVCQIRRNIKQFSVDSKNLIYLTQKGTVCMIFYEDNTQVNSFSETILEWTITMPVLYFKASYAFAAFVLDENEDSREQNTHKIQCYLSNQPQNEGKVNDTKLNILIYHINDIFFGQVNNHQDNVLRLKRICQYEHTSVEQITVGYNYLLLISPERKLHFADLSNFSNVGLNQNALEIKQMQFFKDQYINNIFGNFVCFFVYTKEKCIPLEEWSCEDVLKFVEQHIEFHDYLNIIKYEGIKGTDLVNLSKKTMKDRLGILKDDIQAKLLTEIIKLKDKKEAIGKLYAIGKNESGQLGLNNCNNVNQFTLINMPLLEDGDDLLGVHVGWRNTVLLSQKKRVFISVNNDKKSEKNKQKEDNKIRFVEITQKFTQLNDKRLYSILDVSCSKDYLCVLGNNYRLKKVPKTEVEEEINNKSKLTPAHQIVSRIKWDKFIDENEYTIVYKDRFLKDLEIDFQTFEASDVKSHRITHFKKQGVVVWDREKRYENI